MGALKLDLGCGKSGRAPEVVERVTLPTEDNPLGWVAVVVAIIVAGVMLLWWVPASPPMPAPVLP